jgi:hypothetical protein
MSYDTIFKHLLRTYAAEPFAENAMKLANHLLRGLGTPSDEDYVQDAGSLDPYDAGPGDTGLLTYKALLNKLSQLSENQLNSDVVIYTGKTKEMPEYVAATSFIIGESDEEDWRQPKGRPRQRRQLQHYLLDGSVLVNEDGSEGTLTAPLNSNHPLIVIQHCYDCGVALSELGSWDSHRGGIGPWGGFCADCISGG